MNIALQQPLAGQALPAAENVTHAHLLAVVSTLLRSGTRDAVRILDVGCGDGRLLAYLARCLPALHPGVQFEFVGFDVADGGVQEDDFFSGTVQRLTREVPWIEWRQRLHLITTTEPWPAKGFDVIVSNQVLEHVADLDHFMSQVHECLEEGGLSVHLFPLRECLWEGHLHLPLVHRIGSHNGLKAAIGALSRVGLGIWRRIRKDGVAFDTFVERHADFIQFSTHYRTGSEVLAAAKRARLRADFRHTWGFYAARFWRLFGRSPATHYPAEHPLLGWLAFLFCKRLSSVTLLLENRNTYR